MLAPSVEEQINQIFTGLFSQSFTDGVVVSFVIEFTKTVK